MASICSLNCLQLMLLVLMCTVEWAFSVTESAASIVFKGELNGSVTIRCPVNKQRKVTLLYLQRGKDFVNGYYTSKDMSQQKSWENTDMDKNELAVHINRLNISHNGSYDCIIQYSDDTAVVSTVVYLIVTARYSKPKVTTSCNHHDADFSCLVTCASHGGYPLAKMMWSVHLSGNASQRWNVVNNSEVRNPPTMMYNSSSKAHFNCSKGELKSLSCSVAGVTSDMFSVCIPTTKPDYPYVIIATIICLLVVLIMVVLVLHYKKQKTRHTRAAANVEEAVSLNEAP